MRVFVAGATGVLGRATLRALTEAGHTVFGLARTPEKLLEVDRLGATPVRGDVLDGETMRLLVRQTQPDALVNLATAIPLSLRVNPKEWETNDRVRVEGTRNLLAAAQETTLRLFAQESVGFLCQSQGEDWIREDSPPSAHSFLRATLEMEALCRASEVPTTLLRFGALMSADAWHTQQSIAALRRGLLPILGDGSSYMSLLHTADAAQAILRALDKPDIAAGQTYLVADNEPARMRDVLPYAARCLQASPPRSVPLLLAKALVGPLTLDILAASYRLSNEKIRQALDFAPRYPTYRETWEQIAREVGSRDFSPSNDLR